jgi:hypothetical protein
MIWNYDHFSKQNEEFGKICTLLNNLFEHFCNVHSITKQCHLPCLQKCFKFKIVPFLLKYSHVLCGLDLIKTMGFYINSHGKVDFWKI